MRKLIAFALLACLAACSSKTDTPPAETKSATPESQPPVVPAATKPTPEPVPPEPAPAEAPKTKAPDPPPLRGDAKPADKSTTNTGAKLKPGLYAHFVTNLGSFTAEMNEKEAPGTVANFTGLASGEKEWTDPRTGQKQKKPYYEGLIFHRVIDGFMIQGGDPVGNGTGGPGFGIQDEYNNLRHDRAGTLAMARTGAPNSAGSQFYITVAPQPGLDGNRPPYVVFGYVIEGLDVVLNIGHVPTAPGDRPLTPVVINKITIERVKA